MTNDGRDLAALAMAGSRDRGAELRADDRTRAEYRDEGPWLLLPLLLLASFGFRRGWLAAIALMFALPVPQAHAFEWDALWKRGDQRAYESLTEQQPEQALELAKDPALRGSAAYRLDEFELARSEFVRAHDADSHYNRGNALAKAEQYEDALKAYDVALALQPDMDDALANRKAVEDWLNQQQQQQQNQDSGDSGEKQPGDPSSEQQQGAEGDSEPSEGDEQQDGQPREGESEAQDESSDPASDADAQDESQQQQAQQQFAEQMEQALKDEEQQPSEVDEPIDPREAEKQQAVEQWLRRVPDDPGGLLRRKFALEYQRRLRERGSGED
jgi:Ca-activated chloride channel family protein